MDLKGKKSSRILERKVYKKGDPIFSQGDRGTAAYMVASGRVTIFTSNEDGKDVPLTEVGPNGTFGELALLNEEIRTASASCKEDCELIEISQSELTKRLEKSDKFVKYWVEYLSERVIDLTERLSKKP